MTYKFRTPVALRYLVQIGLVALVCGCATVGAQRRDHLTNAETDVIRFHQQLDKRIEAFIKAADRRLAIINGIAQPSTKEPKKKASMEDEPDWDDLPKGR